MRLRLLTFLFSALLSSQSFAHYFNCNISDISISSGTPDLVYLTMGCSASNPHSSGTGGCTAANISDNIVVFDGSSELGKRYYSLALTALASQKNTYISAYGTCPSNSTSTPLVYSMKLSN